MGTYCRTKRLVATFIGSFNMSDINSLPRNLALILSCFPVSATEHITEVRSEDCSLKIGLVYQLSTLFIERMVESEEGKICLESQRSYATKRKHFTGSSSYFWSLTPHYSYLQ